MEDLYYLQNNLLQQGISVDEFDETNYFELLEGMKAKAPEDRPKPLEEFMGSLSLL